MTPVIYNLFPPLAGPTDRWAAHAERAARMGFNWLYLNPWHEPGFSGSLYAPRDFGKLNPLLVPAEADHGGIAAGASPREARGEPDEASGGGGLNPLRDALVAIRAHGLLPMMDLVVNHTSRDSVLVDEHPTWFLREAAGNLVSPSVSDPDDPSRITVWGDLAEIDHTQEAPRRYWAGLVRDALAMGFAGFRCEAAYKVPNEVWRYLIGTAREVDPGARFFAENLGGPLDGIPGLRDVGFDYVLDSTKWWNFNDGWAMEQHERFRDVVPSISFPESHDTPRLAAESHGSEAASRQWYAFAAAFSAGVMMPVGYEFGFRRPLHVVETRPSDWEAPSFDLQAFVTRVNRLKLQWFRGEEQIRLPWGLGGDVLLLERGAKWILLNKRLDAAFTVRVADVVRPRGRPGGGQRRDGPPAGGCILHRVCRDDDRPVPVADEIDLAAGEVVYILPEAA